MVTNILEFSMAFFYPKLRTLLYTIENNLKELLEGNAYDFIDNKAKVKSGSEEYYIDINGKRIHN